MVRFALPREYHRHRGRHERLKQVELDDLLNGCDGGDERAEAGPAVLRPERKVNA